MITFPFKKRQSKRLGEVLKPLIPVRLVGPESSETVLMLPRLGSGPLSHSVLRGRGDRTGAGHEPSKRDPGRRRRQRAVHLESRADKHWSDKGARTDRLDADRGGAVAAGPAGRVQTLCNRVQNIRE